MDWRTIYVVFRRAVYAVLAEFDRQLGIKQNEK